jgi:hypothetical protein
MPTILCISRVRNREKKGHSTGMYARHRYSNESMPHSGAQLLAALPKDRQESGRTKDSPLLFQVGNASTAAVANLLHANALLLNTISLDPLEALPSLLA